MESMNAVKQAIDNKDFCGTRNVEVISNGKKYTYKNVFVSATYNFGYRQMEIFIDWDNDCNAPSYQSLKLHAGYNTNFQYFSCFGKTLVWQDGENEISIAF